MKRGWITKKGGRYVVEICDQQGRRRKKVLPAGALKRDAKEELHKLEGQVNKGTFTPVKETLTFSQVAKKYIKHKKATIGDGFRITTWNTYNGHINNHFGELNPVKINEINTPMLEEWIDNKRLVMHIPTLRKVLITLGQMFDYAVRNKLIDHNPLTSAERPKGKRKAESKKKMQILNPEQIVALLSKIEYVKYRVLFTLAIVSGARQGELSLKMV